MSDRNLKHDFCSIDADSVLERLAELPVTEWSYIAEEGHVRHLGPMAQDFHAAFGLGADDRHIFTLDADGVSFASIQALYRRVQELERENAELRQENDEARQTLEDLAGRVEDIERRVGAPVVSR